jgi:acetyltransferase
MHFPDRMMTATIPVTTSSRRQALDAFLHPRSVAVIGATETPRTAGQSILENLTTFPGPVYPVNPRRSSAMGWKCYPSIAAAPQTPDLAVIVTPAATVPGIVAECAAKGVSGAIIISAGFKETGEAGLAMEREIARVRGKMRIVGPNCLGVMSPHAGLNASFAAGSAAPGKVAFLSQSGALCTSILDWSLREMVGFSAFVSMGSMLDVSWGDWIEYLGDDPETRAILLYMESIGDARSFLSAAREVALEKPIIVLKAGRTSQAAQAAASHTGALTGSDAVLDAAFRRCGVLRVDRISDLFYMAETLARQPRPAGPRLAIVTNAGGPAVLATDRLISEGGELARISPKTTAALNWSLPQHWSHSNPIDLLGDAAPERFAEAIELTAKDPGVDGVLVTCSPQGVTAPEEVAANVAACRDLMIKAGKPLLASFMGGLAMQRGEEILNAAGIPTFSYPDSAAAAFVSMWRYSDNLRALYETPEPAETNADASAIESLLRRAREGGRTLLTESESKQALAAYGIEVTETEVAATEDEAAEVANALGYPAALKLNSESITHKSDVGGVELHLAGEAAVREAWRRIHANVSAKAGEREFQGVSVQKMEPVASGFELILGSSCDPQFGPVLLFGAGGQFVEIMKDSELGLAPLNTTLARRLMERTRVYKALSGARGRAPVDRAKLEQTLVRFSQLVAENPRIKEIDINPLLAVGSRIVALDARVVLHPWTIADGDLPRPAIRPYPAQYASVARLRDGGDEECVTLRPIRPEDEPAMVRFHQHLSDRSVHFRYFHSIALSERVSHQRLARVCFADFIKRIALVAETAGHEITGVARLTRDGDAQAEFAVIVADQWQDRGIGGSLLRGLISIAPREGIRRIHGSILAENRSMLDVCARLGFDLSFPEDGVIEAALAV